MAHCWRPLSIFGQLYATVKTRAATDKIKASRLILKLKYALNRKIVETTYFDVTLTLQFMNIYRKKSGLPWILKELCRICGTTVVLQ